MQTACANARHQKNGRSSLKKHPPSGDIEHTSLTAPLQEDPCLWKLEISPGSTARGLTYAYATHCLCAEDHEKNRNACTGLCAAAVLLLALAYLSRVASLGGCFVHLSMLGAVRRERVHRQAGRQQKTTDNKEAWVVSPVS